MLRKLMLTGMLGVAAVTGVAATPTTAEAGCRPARVVYHRGYARGYRHWGVRYVAPPVICRPAFVAPCP